MPLDRPSPLELLGAVRRHLKEILAPSLTGQPAFHLRVACNAIAIAERSMAEGTAMDAAELARLCELLGSQGSLLELNEELCRRIRSGDFSDDPADLLTHLRATAADKLALASPNYAVQQAN